MLRGTLGSNDAVHELDVDVEKKSNGKKKKVSVVWGGYLRRRAGCKKKTICKFKSSDPWIDIQNEDVGLFSQVAPQARTITKQ